MYSDERSAQLVLALLKAHGISKVIASPGTTNFGMVGSMQSDPFFEVFSSVDERSAAYMACGMAASSGDPVVLSCTGATASREYLAGLTEAYYRKLPLVAITSFNGTYNVGQLMPQNIDRRVSQSDVKVFSVDLPLPRTSEDERFIVRKVNEALLACRRHGGGPVHINVTCDYARGSFSTVALPVCRVYRRHMPKDVLPAIDGYRRIAVFVGAHVPFTAGEETAIESFVVSHDAVVLCDHTSNYHGARRTLSALAAEGSGRWSVAFKSLIPNLIIDLGEVSGDYVTAGYLGQTGASVWRVSEDGEIRDRFHSLTDVFEMGIEEFFSRYTGPMEAPDDYWKAWERRRAEVMPNADALPFTNRWVAWRLAPMLPTRSVLHMAILNSLRSWNYWEVDQSIDGFCNTGGFGIDGALSTTIGAALVEPDRPHYLFCGDLAFFYDMNSLGNRHLPPNLRILVVNNGLGVEFRMPYSPASVMAGDVDPYVAAAGHFRRCYGTDEEGKVSPIGAWCESLGILYLKAESKREFLTLSEEFVHGKIRRPVVFECIVNPEDEQDAASAFASLDEGAARMQRIAGVAKSVLPTGIRESIRKAIG